jgi:hypothetical protein
MFQIHEYELQLEALSRKTEMPKDYIESKMRALKKGVST